MRHPLVSWPKNQLNILRGLEAHRSNFSWINSIQFLGFSLAFILLVFWNTCHLWTMIHDLNMNDFGKFYYATVDFLNGLNMYGSNPATFIQINDDYGQEFWNLNPPHFHILLFPLAFLPELAALSLWSLANLLALLVVLRLIHNELNLLFSLNQQRLLTLGFLAFAGTGAHFVTGQLSFLLALPVTLAWISARKNQWNKTGMYLGIACSMKLFFLIFLPYLFLQRQFKAMFGIIGVLFGCFGIGLAVFGIEPHLAWLNRLSAVDWHWAGMNASLWGTLSRTFTENPTYQSVLQTEFNIYPLWGILSICMAIVVYYISFSDTSHRSTDRAFAILIVSAIIISPLGWTYYLFLLLGPLTALIWQYYQRFQLNTPQQISGRQYLQTFLLLGSIPGFLMPLVFISQLDSSPLGSLTIGSAYFWSTLMLWGFLVINWWLDNPQGTKVQEFVN